MYPKRFLSALLIAALLLIPAGPALAQAETESDQTIAEIALDNDDFSTLVAALLVANLTETLRGEGPFTVFAPSNAAFAQLPQGLLTDLINDPQGELTDVLLYHVLEGTVLAEDISDGQEAETIQGGYVVFTVDGDSVMINHADIITTNITASNGVIHVINRVLLPPGEEEADVEAEEADEADDADETDMAEEADEADDVEIAENGDTPSVSVEDQVSDGNIVTVNTVTAAQSGWMVIHLDEDGRPGPVIGQTGVPAGMTSNVIIFLEEEIAGDTTLWAMLHVDEGQIGVYEFPGPDVPARVNDTIVMESFVASAPEAEVDDADPADVDDADDTDVDDTDVDTADADDADDTEADDTDDADDTAMTADADDDADDAAVEEAAPPAVLPATGGTATGAPLAISVAVLVMLALAAGSYISRRRLA